MNNIITYAAVATQGGNPEKPVTRAPTKATLKITDTKLYVPIVTWSTEDDNKLLEKLKADFKRAIKWNIYRSEMTNPVRTNNLTYLIDAAFNNVNWLLVVSFENEEDRTFFPNYYTPIVEIKNFNVLIDGKRYFYVSTKNKEDTYKKNYSDKQK